MLSLIIFGTRGVTYTKEQGNFHCPACSDKAGFYHKRVRRFFTLYFIPLIPLDLLGEYIECARCKGTFKDQVLDYDPTAANNEVEAEFQLAIKHVLVDMMMADGVVEENEVATLKDVYAKLTGKTLSEEQVNAEIDRAQAKGTNTLTYLKQVAPMLNGNGKEMVIRAALAMAAADGEFQDEEKTLLSEMAAALDMPTAHLKGIFAELNEG